MDLNRRHFLDCFARAVRMGEATAFVGSGLSAGAKYPSWEGLASSLAELIGLDAKEERADLPAVMQFFVTDDGQHRGRLNDVLRSCFLEEKPIPPAVDALARLRLQEVWTTNYDTLIERALQKNGSTVEVKWHDEQLTAPRRFSSTTVFKMHGTIEHPDSCVVTRDDYEHYGRRRPAFHRTLAERLQSKQFLFLGAGLTDQNLLGVFALLRTLHGCHTRPHFALVKRGNEAGNERQKREFRRAELWRQELKRYGVHPVFFNEYDEISGILEDIRREVLKRVVFVSGTYPEQGEDERLRDRVRSFSSMLGSELARRRLKVVSGFGQTVGSAVAHGVLGQLHSLNIDNVDEALCIQPFPQNVPSEDNGRIYTGYRKQMVERAGVAIFLSGLRPQGENSPGVREEFDLALQNGALVIPIGAFGGASRVLWEHIAPDFSSRLPGVDAADFNLLNDADAAPDALVQAVCRIVETRSGREA